MKTLLNLSAAVAHVVGAIIGRLFAAIGLGVLCAFGFVAMSFRLGLGFRETPGLLLGTCLAFLGLWLGTVLYKTGKLAKGVMISCLVTIAGITIARMLPNTTEAGKIMVALKDQQALELAQQAAVEVIRPFECNKTNVDSISFFGRNGVTGEKVVLINYAFDTKTGRVRCFREKGVDDQTGETVRSVTGDIIKLIAKQSPPEEPKPAATPMQVAVAPVPATVPAAPVVQSIPEPAREEPRKYAAETGQSLMIEIADPIDLGKHGEGYRFEGLLIRDITDPSGIVLARAGTPVGMIINSLQSDPRTNAALLEVSATSLTTTGGTSLPVGTRPNELIAVRPSATRMAMTQRQSRIFGAFGARIPQVRVVRKYAPRPKRLGLTFEDRWVVPATLLASVQ